MTYPDVKTAPFLLFGAPRFFLPNHFGIGARVLILILLTWVPLAILSLLEGHALAATPKQSLLLDVSVYVRFFVSLPLLLISSHMLCINLSKIMHHFTASGIIGKEETARFQIIVNTAMAAKNALSAQLFLLSLVILIAIFSIRYSFPAFSSTWRTIDTSGHSRLSWAGWWLVLVSRPIYNYVVFRFLLAVFLWWILLARVSRLNLQLRATHPDRAGGLGFLGMSLLFFSLPAFAFSAAMAGGIADLVLWEGVSVISNKYLILTYIGFLVILFLLPLLFFVPHLIELKHTGFLSFNQLSSRELVQLENKWVGSEPRKEDILSSTDFQKAKAFLDTVGNVYKIRIFLFAPSEVLPFLAAALLPFVFVFALELPIKVVISKLLSLIT